METGWYGIFIRDALKNLKKRGKAFVYTYEQRDEILKLVPDALVSYDERNGCYWITSERSYYEGALDSCKKGAKRGRKRIHNDERKA